MDEVYALGDRVTVLRDGRLVGSLERQDIRADTIVRLMVGRDVTSFYKKDHDPAAGRGHPVLAASDMADGRRVKGCSLTVHAGEVVGLAGLIGAGRTELAHLIIGASPMTSGHLEMEGRAVTIRTPGEALDAGIAYLTEDRKTLGLFLDMSCLDNINLAVLGRDAKLGYILDRDKARDTATRAFATLGIRAAKVASTAAASGIAAAQETKRQRLRLVIRAAGMLPVLLLLCVGFHFLSDGRFFTGQNLGIVLQQAAVNTVLAAGMTFVILTGGIDLSVGSILAATAMAGLTISKLADLRALCLPTSFITGIGFQFVSGMLDAILR